MKESITIVSTNINKNIVNNYKDYEVISKSFTFKDLLKYKKVLFFNILNNVDENILINLFRFLEDHNISFINFTNNMELSLLTDYLIIYNEKDIVIEGNTLDVLKEEKIIKRLGLKLPFMVELSIYLKDYNLINHIYLDKFNLIGDLWK